MVLTQAGLASAQDLNRYEFESRHMGTTFQIILYADSDMIAHSASDSAFATIENLNNILSDYLPDSQLSHLSQSSGSGKQVPVSKPLFELLERSTDISRETNGWFDITIGPYTHIWRGLNRMSDPTLPSDSEIAKASSKVGYEKIRLDAAGQSVLLQTENMRLDPGGIGKGFASDRALQTLREAGIHRALVNAGGDISGGDPPPGRKGWTVAVPVQFSADSAIYEEILLTNQAINTSGNLYQSVEIDGVTYSHIINPKTGLGHTEQVQVSVISADGATADAFATALSVMPIEDARQLVENRADLEAVITRKRVDGTIDRWSSGGFDELLK